MKRILVATALAVLFLAAAPARAEFPGDVPDTFRITFGVGYSWFNTQVQFDSLSVPGAPPVAVDFENFTGLPSSKAGPTLYGYWNFAGRSFLDFGFLYYKRTRSETISRDIEFGGVTYQAGASVESSAMSSSPYVGYRYGFVKTPSMQLGLSLGVAYTTLEAQLTASGGVSGPGGPIVGTVARKAEAKVWVPLIGLELEGRLADNFTAGLRVLGAGATISPYHGWTIDGVVHFDYYFSRNFGFGLGYQYVKYNVKRTTTANIIDFNYQFDGPVGYFTMTF